MTNNGSLEAKASYLRGNQRGIFRVMPGFLGSWLTDRSSAAGQARRCSPPGRKPQVQGRGDSALPVRCPLGFRNARLEDATLTAARRLDCRDVNLFHLHHRIERAFGGSGIGIGDRFRQGHRRNLPGQSPFVFAPAAGALLAAVADDRVPVTIRFGVPGEILIFVTARSKSILYNGLQAPDRCLCASIKEKLGS